MVEPQPQPSAEPESWPFPNLPPIVPPVLPPPVLSPPLQEDYKMSELEALTQAHRDRSHSGAFSPVAAEDLMDEFASDEDVMQSEEIENYIAQMT